MPKIMRHNLRPYVINKAKDGKSAEVNLYGEIVNTIPTDWWTGKKVDGLYIELEKFLEDLKNLEDMENVRFNINSIGGSVDAGVSIFNKIRSMQANTTTVVEGAADSAAALVAQAGDVRKVCIGSEMMVHCASAMLFDTYNSKQLDEVKNMLDAADKRIAGLLADRTGKAEAEVKRMMQKTTWMTAEEAVENGFADEVVNETVKVENVKDMSDVLIFNGIPHRFNGPVPKVNIVGTVTMDANGAGPLVNTNCQNHVKEEKDMTKDELLAQYPELVKEIQDEATKAAQSTTEYTVKNAADEAVKAERERLQAIDSIASKVSPELLNEAKYGESKMTAEELALKALQEQKDAGDAFMSARADEVKDAKEVKGIPAAGAEADQKAKDIADGAAILNAAAK